MSLPTVACRRIGEDQETDERASKGSAVKEKCIHCEHEVWVAQATLEHPEAGSLARLCTTCILNAGKPGSPEGIKFAEKVQSLIDKRDQEKKPNKVVCMRVGDSDYVDEKAPQQGSIQESCFKCHSKVWVSQAIKNDPLVSESPKVCMACTKAAGIMARGKATDAVRAEVMDYLRHEYGVDKVKAAAMFDILVKVHQQLE